MEITVRTKKLYLNFNSKSWNKKRLHKDRAYISGEFGPFSGTFYKNQNKGK